jgi:hypothetical protein
MECSIPPAGSSLLSIRRAASALRIEDDFGQIVLIIGGGEFV